MVRTGIARSRDGEKLNDYYQARLEGLKVIYNEGTIDDILEAEQILLEEEPDKFGQEFAHKSSLEAGVKEMKIIRAHLKHVRDQKKYRQYARTFVTRPKNMIAGRPKDEAWQCFIAHRARLGNANRADLPDGQHKLLKQRLMHMNRAQEMYKNLQEKALGLDKAAEKEQGMGLGPQL